MQVGHLARVLLPKFLPCKLRSASTGNPVKSMVSFQVTPCCIYRAGLEESCNYDEWLSCGQGAHLLHARAEGKAQVISLELPPGFRNETGWGTWYSRRRLFISRQQTEADPFGRNCSPLERAKVFILGAVSGMEACGVSGEGFFSLESQECQMQTSGLCPARMLRVVWGGCCEGILTKGSFAFRYRMLQAWDLSSESKEFFWMQSRR